MKDYNKLSDLNDLDKNPHTFYVKDPKMIEDPFFLNSPSSCKTLNNKPKLATIDELPHMVKSKSTTEIATGFFEDDFKIPNSKLNDDDSYHSDVEFNLRRENLNEKSFFRDEDVRSSAGNMINSQHDDPFLIKTPTFKNRRPKKPKELAVDIRNVTYQYGVGRKATKVLNDISLKVPLGGIYGLLGPSGCGKTSLLKIMIGMNRPDKGMVRVFGVQPGRHSSLIPGPGVGYMPQDISLFSDLTVAETLIFYSKIYHMDPDKVPERIEFLLKLLDLRQKGNRMIKQLSGGQKRRVSLAAALVHTPPLVILDEPTVGVDPLLRQQIWEHLVQLSDETALTVILTTHYIEEARQANTVGLMRFGRILIESNPEKLMLKYKRTTLEDVFLDLCTFDEKEFKPEDTSNDEDSYKSQLKFEEDGVHYNATPVDDDEFNEDRKKTTSDEVPKVVVSDYSLPLSPHMVREKENENFDQGSIYVNKSDQQKQTKTPVQDNKMVRSPLSPLNSRNDKNDFLQVQAGRNRADSNSSLGSSIIEYDSISSRDSTQTPVKVATFKKEFKHTFESKNRITDRLATSVTKISALFYKNITLLTRNIPLLLFQFFLPSLEIILFAVCIGADPFDLPVAIFNQDTSGNLPQRFLSSIDNYTVNQVHYPTLPLAIDAVRNGNAWGAIAFKENFSTSLAERHIMGLNADNETLDHSSIYFFLDMTNQLIGYKLQRTFLESFQKFSKELLIEQNSNPNSVNLPIKIGKPIYGDKEPTFTEFMAPGVVLTIAFLATVALTALAFVMERKDGILERILVSGVTPFEFLMSHVVTQLCVIVVQVALLLIFTFLVFDIPSRGPFIWVIALTMAQAICGMQYGLLISSLCESETAATMMALGSFYPNLLLSGTVWPTQAMPEIMRYFSYILPQTLPIESMRYILSRGWDPINHFEVTIGFIITVLWTVFFLIVTLLAFRKIY